MTDEATAVVPPGAHRGDGIFDGRRAVLDGQKREMGKRDEDVLGLMSMTGGATNTNQIEEVVAGLDMEKLKQNLLDDFIAKIKGQLIDSSRREDDIKKRRELDDLSPRQSSIKVIPNTKQRRQYQATVEDDTDDASHHDKAGQGKDFRPQLHISTNEASQRPSPPSSVISSGSSHSSVTDSLASPDSESVMSLGGSRPRPRVRFTDRPLPPVLSDRSSEASPKHSAQTMVRVNSLSSQSSPRQSAESMLRAESRCYESSPQQSAQTLARTNSRSGAAPPQKLPPVVVRTATPNERPIEAVWSAVDLKWGMLFTDKDEPTPRLHQVLRGLASYLIAEYSPRNSLVIPPEKLYKFYKEYSLDSPDFIDFSRMFDYRSARALDSLARLYQTLDCEFHLIQDKPGSIPDVPALTPSGFAHWVITLIQVFPDREADRLASVVADLPFEAEGLAVDGSSERVPRQLSRHLLPTKQVYKQYMALADAIVTWKRSLGLSSEVSATSPTVKPASTRTAGGSQGRGVVELEVPRRRGEKYHRDPDRRGSNSRDDGPRRYSRHVPSRHHRQEVPLAPPPMGRHAPPPRSPASEGRFRREVSRTMSAGDANYAVSSGRPAEAMDPQRRSREEEYRAAQGRDRWGSLDSSTPRGVSGGMVSPVVGTAAAAAAASRRRSLIVAASQAEGNPTYEEYLAAEKGGGYDG